jgi:hypothetical protein
VNACKKIKRFLHKTYQFWTFYYGFDSNFTGIAKTVQPNYFSGKIGNVNKCKWNKYEFTKKATMGHKKVSVSFSNISALRRLPD